ncbi:hypothetical protein L7F22_052996, partial [Adiantum nelumboides]|nr:hypothetical protein [Adiantum nelumboides]
IRRQTYMEGYSRPKENLGVLDDLIASRHETAKILGYESYADFNLAPTMAASSDVVHSFLLGLSEKLRGKADEEFKMLEKFGEESEGASFKGVNPWDEAYYMCLMKAGTFGLNAKVVASYFPLKQCIEGLKLITKSLFGAVLEEVRLAQGHMVADWQVATRGIIAWQDAAFAIFAWQVAMCEVDCRACLHRAK